MIYVVQTAAGFHLAPHRDALCTGRQVKEQTNAAQYASLEAARRDADSWRRYYGPAYAVVAADLENVP